MKRSTDRILTTHTGSLPRPAEVTEMIVGNESGRPTDPPVFEARVRQAVVDIVRQQREAGVDIINDGEMGKPGYSTYIKDRTTGFDGEQQVPMTLQGEARDFPEWNARRLGARPAISRPTCTGPVAWKDFAAVKRDIDDLKAATQGVDAADVFMSAASPGVIAHFLENRYYPSHEAYLEALAAVMKDEYEAIHAAGFVLQIDCPDLAMVRHLRHSDLSNAEFRKFVALHIEVLNEATKNIPAEQMRLHLCWGNYEGPHHLDIPLKEIIDLVLKGRPAAISFEGANPRHEHEWQVWQEVKLPDDKVIIPGVLDSTTNFIEHPELVAQRLIRYAEVVGKERVIAGTDCGFGTFATSVNVDPRIVWAKFQSMAEGARLASKSLW